LIAKINVFPYSLPEVLLDDDSIALCHMGNAVEPFFTEVVELNREGAVFGRYPFSTSA
jgi:hypothetical protein